MKIIKFYSTFSSRFVCQDRAEILSAMEDDLIQAEKDIDDYVAMKNFCDKFNKVVDSVKQLVNKKKH